MGGAYKILVGQLEGKRSLVVLGVYGVCFAGHLTTFMYRDYIASHIGIGRIILKWILNSMQGIDWIRDQLYGNELSGFIRCMPFFD
jgi:hypothetical protein